MMKWLVSICIALLCLEYAASKVNVAESWKMVDKDGNERISRDEFDLMAYDTDDDNKVSNEEFVTGYIKSGASKDQALYFFYMFDMDNDFAIDKSEEDILFGAFDSDKGQTISYHEFTSSMYLLLNQYHMYEKMLPGYNAMFDIADANSNGKLEDRDEMWGIFSPADTDKSGSVNETEMILYRMAELGDSKERAERFFKKLNTDGDDSFGDGKADMKTLLSGDMDVDTDAKLSRQEFLDGMLYIYAGIRSDIERDGLSLISMSMDFNSSAILQGLDANNDGKVSVMEGTSFITSADTDRDNKLSIEEYVTENVKAGVSRKGSLYTFFKEDLDANLTLDESEMRKAFYKEDRNRDGFITEDEARHATRSFLLELRIVTNAVSKLAFMVELADVDGDGKMNDTQLWNTIAAADSNGDRKLSKAEFVEFWMTHVGLEKDFTLGVFNVLDSNRNGFFGDMPEADSFYSSADVDHDGLVSGEEFLDAMLWIFAKVSVGIDKEIKMQMQGKFNSDLAFNTTDADKNGFLNMQEYEDFMMSMDKNNDREVSVEEFVPAYSLLGMSSEGVVYVFFITDSNNDLKITIEEVEANFGLVDMDGNKVISRHEFKAVMSQILHQLSEASMAGYRLARVFYAIDYDNSGKVSQEELKGLFDYIDSDPDKSVSKEEFVDFWTEATGEPSDRSAILFGMLDHDENGKFGNNKEIPHTFDTFDYNGDNSISMEEFLYTNLALFAKVVGIQEQQYYAKLIKEKTDTAAVIG